MNAATKLAAESAETLDFSAVEVLRLEDKLLAALGRVDLAPYSFRERTRVCRVLILARGIADALLDSPTTYREAFERVYHEPLGESL